MKGSCPEPKIMTGPSPLGAMQQRKQDRTNPCSIGKEPSSRLQAVSCPFP